MSNRRRVMYMERNEGGEMKEKGIGPWAEDDSTRPQGDPFEPILKPMLERDTKQCDAWKDEVQNILIFKSGLFSAVVTAFIIESYQRLQPDPHDTVIFLLSSIASQVNSTTTPTATSRSPEVFTPSSSDIRINVFWFISLVLSLTVALIGIISLQWLREHQRYDSRIEPSKAFAIFNARSEGLKRWYVPQIFASLPLLLQAALVLFLAGIIDFLFTLHKEVAIPVTVVAGIPSIFLLVTTALPTLQMCAIRLPYLLSVNQSVPAPCPYKSPQSLIFRRITRVFDTLLGNGAWVFAILYIPIATFRRYIRGLDFYSICGYREVLPQAVNPFKGPVDPWFKISQLKLASASGDWTMADDYWLTARTSYALITNTPEDLREPWTDRSFALKSSVASTFYDTVQGIQRASYEAHNSDAYTNALYNAGQAIIINQLQGWLKEVSNVVAKTEKRRLLMRSRCISLMSILGPEGTIHSRYLPNDYSDIQPGDLLPRLDVLHSAYKAALLQRFLARNTSESIAMARILYRWDEAHIKMISRSLLNSPEELFKCTSTSGLVPAWFLCRPTHYRSLVIHYTDIESRKRCSSRWTVMLNSFIIKSFSLPPWTSSCPHILAPTTRGQCQSNFFYENVDDLVRYIVTFQTDDDIIRISALLKDLCQTASDPIQGRPFVVVIACAYVNAMAMFERHRLTGFSSLFQVLHSICGGPSRTLRPGDTKYAWDGLRFSMEYVRSYQVQSESVELLTGSRDRREDGLEDFQTASVITNPTVPDIV